MEGLVVIKQLMTVVSLYSVKIVKAETRIFVLIRLRTEVGDYYHQHSEEL